MLSRSAGRLSKPAFWWGGFNDKFWIILIVLSAIMLLDVEFPKPFLNIKYDNEHPSKKESQESDKAKEKRYQVGGPVVGLQPSSSRPSEDTRIQEAAGVLKRIPWSIDSGMAYFLASPVS